MNADHAILDGVAMGIVTTNEDGRITFLNRHARELLHLHDDVIGLAVHAILGLDRAPQEMLGAEHRVTISCSFVPAMVAPDSPPLDLEVSITRGDGVDDAGVRFFLIFRDVREEKQREAERSRFERLAAMGTMVAGFAHEVRNPVAALRSISEELSEELLAANLSLPHAKRMVTVLDRIERLVRTWLRFGHPAAPKRLVHRPWTLCSSALSAVAQRTMAAHDQIRVEIEPDLPDLYVDAEQIMQALVILLDNALDSAGAPSLVLVRARLPRESSLPMAMAGATPRPSFVLFEVTDEGPGIPPEILSQIFDPFFTTKPTGTGLGLAIAQQIVSENGGRLEVSAPRDGLTTFAVLLPVLP